MDRYDHNTFFKNIRAGRIDPRQSAWLENRIGHATTKGQICADFESQLGTLEKIYFYHKTNIFGFKDAFTTQPDIFATLFDFSLENQFFDMFQKI